MIFKNLLQSLLLLIFTQLPLTAQTINLDSLAYFEKKIKQKGETCPVDSLSFFFYKARSFADVYTQIVLLRKEAKMLTDRSYQNASLNRLMRAQSLAEKHNLPVAEILIKNSLSYYYYHFNQFLLSYQALLDSKTRLEKITPEQIHRYNEHNKIKFTKEDIFHTIISNIGVITFQNDEFDKATDFINQSLTYSIAIKDSTGIIDAKINLAAVLHGKKQYNKSIKAFKEIGELPGLSKSDLSLVHYNLAMNYYDMDSLQQAAQAIDSAIKYSLEIKDQVLLIDLYFLKSEIENKWSHYEEERRLLSNSIAIASYFNDDIGLMQAYEAMAESERRSKNDKKAIFWYKKLLKLQDSIIESDEFNTFKKIEVENNLLQKQQENEYQALEISNAKSKAKLNRLLFILTTILSVSLFVLWFLTKRNYSKKRKIALQQKKIDEIEIQNIKKLQELEREKMQSDLNAKKRELLVSLLFVKKRKEKQKSINKEIDKIAGKSVINKSDLVALKNFVSQKAKELDEEGNVQQKLVNTHKDFFNKLLENYPDLSKTELKILAYLRIGMTTKEIAEVQYVSIDAIRKSRYRIRKKLHLNSSESLEKFIMQYH